MDTTNGKFKDAAYIGGMVLAWAGYYLASSWTVSYTSSAFAAGMVLRLTALIWLTVYILCKKEFRQLFKQGKVTWILLVIGILGYLLDVFANVGFKHGSVGTGTVLLKTDVLMANVATAVIFKQKLRASDWAATAVMLAGVVLVLDIDYGNFTFNWYDLFFIASALSVTVNAFVIKDTQSRYSTSSDVIAYYNNFVVLLLFTISALISGEANNLGNIVLDWKFFVIIAAGGLAQSLIYVFYYRNLKRFPVWTVKLYLLLVPLISCLVGVFAFGEGFNYLQGIGVALVLLGAVVILLRDKINKKSLPEQNTEILTEENNGNETEENNTETEENKTETKENDDAEKGEINNCEEKK